MIEKTPKADLVGLIARDGVNLQVLCTLGNVHYQMVIPLLPLNSLNQTFIFDPLCCSTVCYLRALSSLIFRPNLNINLCGGIYGRFELKINVEEC